MLLSSRIPMSTMPRKESSSAPAGFLQRISEALPEMSPAERQLGEFLLDFPGELASYDAQEVARLSGVSKATVSRFVRSIGFDSYESARKAAREESLSGSRLFLEHSDTDTTAFNINASLEEERDNQQWTFDRIDPSDLEDLVNAILSSRKVWIIGHRISHCFATYLYWQLIKVAPDIAVVPSRGESLGEHIAAMSRDDLVIHFALRRQIGGTDKLLTEIRQQGIDCALVSDEGMPFDPEQRWHFRCRTSTSSPQYNHATVLSLCHQIVIRATVKAGQAGHERLRRIEDINRRIDQ